MMNAFSLPDMEWCAAGLGSSIIHAVGAPVSESEARPEQGDEIMISTAAPLRSTLPLAESSLLESP